MRSGQRAAKGQPTAESARNRRLSFKRRESISRARGRQVARGEANQSLRVGMQRSAKNVFVAAFFNHPSGVHHGNAIHKSRQHRGVVGDENERRVMSLR